MSQEPDQVIAQKYRLVRRLARGGMGAVWLARHLELDTEVALKFVRTEETRDDQADARFRREARAAAQLKSPHVVHIHDFGFDDGTPYLAMELLQGEDLEERLTSEGRLSLGESAALIAAAGKGVRAAHEAGIVHRDLKPSNLFVAKLGGEEVVKVLDFGIARGGAGDDGETTTQGLVFGSPAYMSPEQARGGKVDARSDLWSLGAVLFRMVTGKSPFPGANPSDVVVKICTEDAVAPSSIAPELSAEVDAFFRRALHRDPGRRFQSVDDFVGACSTWTKDAELFEAPPPSVARGRVDETAPLEVPPEVRPSARPSLRTSVAPERIPPSPTSGRWAIRALLLVLGLGGTWLVHVSRQAALEKDTPAAGAPDGSQDEGRPDALTEGTALPANGADRSADPDAIGAPRGEAKPTAAKKPTNSEASPIGRAPPKAAGPRPPGSSPRPSPEKRAPLERPSTDPVFGLPVDSP